MKIAVHGSYFSRNFGDTLLVKIICDWVKKSGSHEIVLPMVASDLEAKEIGARKINDDEWKEVALVVYTGGGYFGEPNSTFLKRQYWYFRNWKRHLQWLSKAKKAGKIIMGVGFGPLNNWLFRKKVFSLFKDCSKIYLRDEQSINWVKKYGYTRPNVFQSIDLAFSIGRRNEKLPVFEEKDRIIGIHIPVSDEKIAEFYFQKLKPLLKDNNIEFICDAPSQSKLLERPNSFYNKCNAYHKIKVVEYPGCEELITQLKRYSTIITSKLHVGIVSTNLGIPVYSMPMHTKTTRYYEQIDYSSNCNPVYQFDESKHTETINNIHNIPGPRIPAQLYAKLDTMESDLNDLIQKISKME